MGLQGWKWVVGVLDLGGMERFLKGKNLAIVVGSCSKCADFLSLWSFRTRGVLDLRYKRKQFSVLLCLV